MRLPSQGVIQMSYNVGPDELKFVVYARISVLSSGAVPDGYWFGRVPPSAYIRTSKGLRTLPILPPIGWPAQLLVGPPVGPPYTPTTSDAPPEPPPKRP